VTYWWVPVTILSSALAGLFSYRMNQSQEWSWSMYLWILNAVPLWIFIARYSKNILLDGLIYDSILTIAYTATVLYLSSKDSHFTTLQWISLCIIILGLLAFKLGEKI
jgi:CHASE2 domain-containing sensor protein